MAWQHMDGQRGTFEGTWFLSYLLSVPQNGLVCSQNSLPATVLLHCDWETFIKDPQKHYKHRHNEFSHQLGQNNQEIPIIMDLPIESVCQELRQNWRRHLDKSAPDKYMKYRRQAWLFYHQDELWLRPGLYIQCGLRLQWYSVVSLLIYNWK